VANESDNLISVLDLEAKKVTEEVAVGVEPEGVAVNPNGTLVAATSETTSMVHIVDASTLSLIDNILVDTRPRSIQFSPDSKRLWVSSELRGTVTVLETENWSETAKLRFNVPGVPRELVQAVGIALTRDGKRAYVALGPSNRVAEVDAETFSVLRYYLVGQRVWHIALSSDEKRLYTANGNSGDVTVIDLVGRQAIKSIPVGRGPWGVVVAP
jgi:PQQ-dependent catabolism-associated beta-propeller protein